MNPMTKEAEFKKIISEEKAEFRKQLPDLLEKYRGQWIVFKGGRVMGAFESLQEAYAKGLELFGTEDPFLIEEVCEEALRTLSFSFELGTGYVT